MHFLTVLKVQKPIFFFAIVNIAKYLFLPIQRMAKIPFFHKKKVQNFENFWTQIDYPFFHISGHSATSKPPSSASNIQHGTSNAFFRLGRFQSKQLNSNNSGNLQMSAPPKQSRYGSSILGGTFSNFASKFKKKDTIKNTMPPAEEFSRPTFIPETISSCKYFIFENV